MGKDTTIETDRRTRGLNTGSSLKPMPPELEVMPEPLGKNFRVPLHYSGPTVKETPELLEKYEDPLGIKNKQMVLDKGPGLVKGHSPKTSE